MDTKPGATLPMGVSLKEGGHNFALFAEHADRVRFFLFLPNNPSPILEVSLDPAQHRTDNTWHIWVGGVPKEAEYGFQVDGPYDPGKGLLYNGSVILTDPYAKSLNFPKEWGKERPPYLLGGVVTETPFDWQDDKSPQIPPKELIIYEMHVRGFTQDPSSGVKSPGTYLGLIEKIPHLKKLGITAVELLPVFEFNECEYALTHPESNAQLYNYWGYSTVNFFSPMKRYASSAAWNAEITEFKTMVRELHKEGIEVILDVVFNHTGEKEIPYSFRGIDNSVYYMLDQEGKYKNYSGCGNTLNCNDPVVTDLIVQSLRYWVTEMHIDGFRFDLASILTRDVNGTPLADPPVIAAITNDPTLSHVKLIAEAWDAGGLYQVGNFPYSERWADWNGKYRDTVRDFIKGTNGVAEAFVQAITGSEHLYGKTGSPYKGINFLTAHDGFSLQDLVSYNHKHNEANCEENRDGTDDNRSWNCGAEGKTDDREIQHLRTKQKKNFIFTLMFSLGIPMILMGDEYGRTAQGNNNTWCQDNALNWFLWNELENEASFFRFYASMIQLRKALKNYFPEGFHRKEDIDWHGIQARFHPDWSQESRFVALTIKNKEKKEDLYIAFNAYHYELNVLLPPHAQGKTWARIVDTALPSPQDFSDKPHPLPPFKQFYKMEAHSALLLKNIPL